jgi:hypothetical protein
VTPVIERGRDDSHDHLRFAVDANGAAYDVGPAAEAILPAPSTNEDDAIVAEPLFSRPKVPPELRC